MFYYKFYYIFKIYMFYYKFLCLIGGSRRLSRFWIERLKCIRSVLSFSDSPLGRALYRINDSMLLVPAAQTPETASAGCFFFFIFSSHSNRASASFLSYKIFLCASFFHYYVNIICR